MMKELKISRAEMERTLDELIGDWCNDFCEQVHCQCMVTYGSRRGYEERDEQKQ